MLTADWHLGSDASAVRLAPARGRCRSFARCCHLREAGLQVGAQRVSGNRGAVGTGAASEPRWAQVPRDSRLPQGQ